MSEYHFPVPGVGDEKILFMTRRHWASMLGSFFIILFMVTLPPILAIAIPYTGNITLGVTTKIVLILFASIYYLVVASFALVQWISYYYNVFLITDDEIIDIDQRGVFDRQINQISTFRIQDVSGQIKGILPTLFAYGNVVAESAGEKTRTYVINDIPNPLEVADRIVEIHNKALAREARKKQMGANGEPPANIPSNCLPCPPGNQPPNNPSSTPPSSPPAPVQKAEGYISRNDLNSGGKIDL